ncbi:MAG: HAMP domain-containing histidine kinase [Oscillospiraceae bacterium]|jgi:signal transduction histidine kinase|nr:HAMP domain-containing histidine kinase [Oscillospiraceae bacterium]
MRRDKQKKEKKSNSHVSLHSSDALIRMAKKSNVTQRWIRNFFSFIVLILAVVAVLTVAFVRNYYYSNIEQLVIRRATVAQTYFSATAGASALEGKGAEFMNAAQGFAESFENRDKMELQFIDITGAVVVTSTGFDPVTPPLMEDYEEARRSENGLGVYRGENRLGEDILAVTQMISNRSGIPVAAARVIVSLEGTNRALFYVSIFVSVLSLMVLIFVLMSGFYFIRSIVAPIKTITSTASDISVGNFDIRLKKNTNDEIGDLVDSINAMAESLAANEKLKNDFISSVSHELRTPLTAIKGWGETIKMVGAEDSETLRKGMDVIISEAGRLGVLVEDLLDFSRLQSGRMKMSLEKLDIVAEVAESVYLFSDKAQHEEKILEFYEAENLPPIMGDRQRLRQVFVNLIDNAIKYSEKGGKIIVAAEADGNIIRVMVRDYGCGIAEEDLKMVTRRFYKANVTRRGFGIGLGVAEEIVLKHGGTIDIASKQGEGTVVSVNLPIASSANTVQSANSKAE